MAPSQLKSLKASLHQQGLVGAPPSKKDRRLRRPDAGTAQQRQQRADALADLRARFNPFEVKQLARGTKYGFANDTTQGAVLGRPGVNKGRGEEMRRKTLLKEVQQRQKVGGLVDRRFGEDDPTLAPEDKALQRFMREQANQSRKAAMFDLEEEEEDDNGVGVQGLTHLGRALALPGPDIRDDFDSSGLENSDNDIDDETARRSRKRRHVNEGLAVPEGDTAGTEDRPKTRKEVMKEVIAKSKLHRFERQKTKDDDEDLREHLDAGTADVLSLLRGRAQATRGKSPSDILPEPALDPDRAALLAGKDRDEADREYDMRLRQMTQDARAQPTTPSKTEAEKARETADRLHYLEVERLRRMRGESVSEDSPDEGVEREDELRDEFDEENILGQGLPVKIQGQRPVEDEDEFELDADLIAEGSDLEFESPDTSDDPDVDTEDSDEREFVAGLLSDVDEDRIAQLNAPNGRPGSTADHVTLSFTYPCPQTHEELVAVTRDTAHEDLHTIIQRIRALYHSGLAEANRDKLGRFAAVLVAHLPYLARQSPRPPAATLEALVRHVHSLAKTHPTTVAAAYRDLLRAIVQERPLALDTADLLVLTAIGSTFPTSDQFHPVATPAMMILARFTGQGVPQTVSDVARGLYACTLCLRFQSLSGRYVPEVINYLMSTLAVLAPTPLQTSQGDAPVHRSPVTLRIQGPPLSKVGRLRFADIEVYGTHDSNNLQQTLLATALRLVEVAAALWAGKPAFPDIFAPFITTLAQLRQPTNASHFATSINTQLYEQYRKIRMQVRRARATRLPLALHAHRPLPIKQAVPKFEPEFHPARHYDADPQRAEGARLRAAHRRERKGAVRALRQDAAFLAREGLREQLSREQAYNDKFRRLVATIQSEEGAARGQYEREKRMTRGKR